MGKPGTLSRRADHGNGASDNKNIVLLRPEFLAMHTLEGVELWLPKVETQGYYIYIVDYSL